MRWTPGAVRGLNNCIHGRPERGLDLLWDGHWAQVGRSIHEQDVDRDREERKEGEEGGAL